MGTGGPLPGGKARDADHSAYLLPSSRMSRSYTPPSSRLHGGSWTALFCFTVSELQILARSCFVSFVFMRCLYELYKMKAQWGDKLSASHIRGLNDYACRDWENPRKNVRKTCLRADIWTRNLAKTEQVCYEVTVLITRLDIWSIKYRIEGEIGCEAERRMGRSEDRVQLVSLRCWTTGFCYKKC
jgi:hypothetical protein